MIYSLIDAVGLTMSCEPGLGTEMFISDDLAVTISVEPIPLGKIT